MSASSGRPSCQCARVTNGLQRTGRQCRLAAVGPVVSARELQMVYSGPVGSVGAVELLNYELLYYDLD